MNLHLFEEGLVFVSSSYGSQARTVVFYVTSFYFLNTAVNCFKYNKR